MGSDRSCPRNRLMPVGVRLPVGRRGHTQAVQLSAPPWQCSPPRNGFSPDASVSHSARSVAPVQTCAPRSTDSATGVALWRKRTPSRRFHRPPPAVCSRFAPLPHVRRSVSPPQRCLCARHANGMSRAPADSTFPFPGLRGSRRSGTLHPSFSLSFPCPKSFSRGCC